MISSRSMHRLNTAMNSIMDPQSNTSSIKEGEQILKQIRTIPEYPLMIAQFLTACDYSPLIDIQRSFLLLELRKIVPVKDHQIWVHLVKFYYGCNQKKGELVLEIIKQELQLSLNEGNQSTTFKNYIEFYREILTNDCIGFIHLNKMLDLTLKLIKVLRKDLRNSRAIQNKNGHLIREHCMILSGQLSKVYEREYATNSILTQKMIISVLTLSQIVAYVEGNHHQHQMLIQFLRFEGREDDGMQLTTISKFLLSPSHTQHDDFNVQNVIIDLLLQSDKAGCSSWFQLTNQLIFNKLVSPRGNELILSQWQFILKVYFDYLMNHLQQANWNRALHDLQDFWPWDDGCREDVTTPALNTFKNRYTILSQCIKAGYSRLQQILLREADISVIVVSAFAEKQFKPWNCSCQIIISFLQKSLHHSNVNNPNPFIFCCLLYAWRYFSVQPPFNNLLHLCYCLLDIRIGFSSLQSICDGVLIAMIPLVLTCSSGPQIRNFAQLMIKNVQENQMSRTAQSYVPIIVILENSENICDILGNEQLLQISSHLMEHLMEEQSQKNQDSMAGGLTNFQLFYKLAEILIKGIQDYKINASEEYLGQQERQVLYQLLTKIQKYTFRNALYSCETGLLYAYYLTLRPEGLSDAYESLHNMQDPLFWKGFDSDDCSFYAILVVKLITFLQGEKEVNCLIVQLNNNMIEALKDLICGVTSTDRSRIVQAFHKKVERIEEMLEWKQSELKPFYLVLNWIEQFE